MPKLKIISPQQAHDAKMFGPIYHGTNEEKLKEILKNGFKIFVGNERSGDISHGYSGDSEYAWGSPPPIHHLGYGIYFTTKKSIAKQFGYGSAPKHIFYITEQPHEINFGSPNTMMKWWVENGYDTELAKKDRVSATKKLTNQLKRKYKAIWFKGQGIRKLLDGDQVVVFDTSIIRGVDNTKAGDMEIGSRVEKFQEWKFIGKDPKERQEDSNWKLEPLDSPKTGVIVNFRTIPPMAKNFHPPGVEKFVEVKFDKGGRDTNGYADEFRPYKSKRKAKSKFVMESTIIAAALSLTEGRDHQIERMVIEPEMLPLVARYVVESYLENSALDKTRIIKQNSATSKTRIINNKDSSSTAAFRQKTDVARRFLDKAVQLLDQSAITLGDVARLAQDDLKTPIQNVIRAILNASQDIEKTSKNSIKELESTAIQSGYIKSEDDVETKEMPSRTTSAKKIMAAMKNEIYKADQPLIHVAPWSVWNNIKKEGLKTRGSGNRGIYCDKPDEPRIYMFEDQNTAEDAMMSWMLDLPQWEEEMKAAFIEVDVSGLSINEDPEISGSYYVTEDIPASRIRLKSEEYLGEGVIGNCVNSFDERGKCTNPDLPYSDVTDFARDEESGFPELKDAGVEVDYDEEKDIHTFYKESLLVEKKGAAYKHAVTMLDMPKAIADKVMDWQKENIDEDDIYTDEENNQFGLEDEIHTTVIYGIKNEDFDKVKELVKDFGSIEVELDGFVIFDNADNDLPYEVLNINVKGDDIQRLHKLIKDNVENKNKWPDYKPHVCVGYLKKGTSEKYKDIEPPFEGEKVTFDSFTFKSGGEPGDRFKKKINLGEKEETVSEGVIAMSVLNLEKSIKNMLKEKFSSLARLVQFEDDESEDLRVSVSIDETPVFQSNAYDKNHPLGKALRDIAKEHGRKILPEGDNTILFTKAGVSN